MDYKFSNLQIGDNDLIGNKFNGHDLHLHLRERGINAFHYVYNKESKDDSTFIYSNNDRHMTLNLVRSRKFVEADIVHLHLIHNTNFDINYLPLITSLKPTVITLHDAFFLAGHCLHSEECEKWKQCCYDCTRMDTPKYIEKDETALLYEIKRQAFQNSSISIIVASDFLHDRVLQSPIMSGKKVFKIPFGINQELFKPYDIVLAKRKIGIDENQFVLMFRADPTKYKGINIIKDCLEKLPSENNYVILTVGFKGLLDKFKKKFHIIEHDWIKDDKYLSSLYQACDIFLMPSEQEAFGMMAIEAMSCGKTVLSIKNTSLEKVTNAPECGVCVDKEDYFETLVNLINNKDELQLRGEKSLNYALQNFAKEVYIDRMILAYEEIIRTFNPVRNASLVVDQLSKHGAIDFPASFSRNANSAIVSDWELAGGDYADYTKTISWRITKPLRFLSKIKRYVAKHGIIKTVKKIFEKLLHS